MVLLIHGSLDQREKRNPLVCSSMAGHSDLVIYLDALVIYLD